jgi:hypothetical protein
MHQQSKKKLDPKQKIVLVAEELPAKSEEAPVVL